VWDTAGQESFKSITRAYYKGSIGALLVFDFSSQSTFDSLQVWLQELKTHSHHKMRVFLIGNKSDLREREVSEEAVLNFRKQFDI
jgi:Ras-related protein Rab-2A